MYFGIALQNHLQLKYDNIMCRDNSNCYTAVVLYGIAVVVVVAD